MENKYKFVDENKEHLHILNGKALCGTTTVLSILAKPLTWWASGLAVKEICGIEDTKVLTKIKNFKATKKEKEEVEKKCKEALENINKMELVDFIDLMSRAYKAHSVKLVDSAEKGVDLHYEVEKYVKSKIEGDEFFVPNSRIAPFVEWCNKNVKRFIWSEAYCFSEKYWLGGCADVGVELNNGELAIVDIKSAKEGYYSHYWQCSAYDIQLSENGGYDKDGNLLFKLDKEISKYIIFPFGAKEVKPYICTRTAESKKAFLGLLEAYKESLFYQNYQN